MNVSGVWLEELGFQVGNQVRITTRDKLLIIEPVDDNAQAEVEYKSILNGVKQTLKKLVP
ncbi:MAG: type I toxin-antitoxin system SymE family toxin [Flavobacteriaceae bacterium]|nr:type I toxin-antitoxin system SymE family toxin [Flavobacteriaceae bacterium]